MSTHAEQLEFRRLHREISRQKTRAGRAHDQMIAALTRAHDLKIRVKSAEGSAAANDRLLKRAEWALRAYADKFGLPFDDERIVRAVERAQSDYPLSRQRTIAQGAL